MSVDLVVHNGIVVTPDNSFAGGLAIDDGLIVAVGADGVVIVKDGSLDLAAGAGRGDGGGRCQEGEEKYRGEQGAAPGRRVSGREAVHGTFFLSLLGAPHEACRHRAVLDRAESNIGAIYWS